MVTVVHRWDATEKTPWRVSLNGAKYDFQTPSNVLHKNVLSVRNQNESSVLSHHPALYNIKRRREDGAKEAGSNRSDKDAGHRAFIRST